MAFCYSQLAEATTECWFILTVGMISVVGDLTLSLILQLAEAAILFAFCLGPSWSTRWDRGKDIGAWMGINWGLIFKLSSGSELVWGMSCRVVRWQFELDFRRWLIWWHSASRRSSWVEGWFIHGVVGWWRCRGGRGKSGGSFFYICQRTQGRDFPQYFQKLGAELCQKVLLLLLADIGA